MWIFSKNKKNEPVEKPEDYVDLLTKQKEKEEKPYVYSFYSSDDSGSFRDTIINPLPYGYVIVNIQLDADSNPRTFLVKAELYVFIKQEYDNQIFWGNDRILKKDYEEIIELLKKNEAIFHVPSLDISVGYEELKKLAKDGKISFSEYLEVKADPMGGGDSSEDSLTDVLVKQQKED